MEKKIDISITESEQLKATNNLLLDTVSHLNKANTNFKHIVIALIISFTMIVCTMVGGFVWYESQFEYVSDTETTEIVSEGESSTAEYVNGNQYNDNAQHTESEAK